eukprot:s187_g30.t2
MTTVQWVAPHVDFLVAYLPKGRLHQSRAQGPQSLGARAGKLGWETLWIFSAMKLGRRERQRGCSPWAELSVLDPTREGTESLSLVPRLHPATQLLLGHELQRAYQRFEAHGDNREMLEDALRPVPEGINALPSFIEEPLCALMVCGELSTGFCSHLQGRSRFARGHGRQQGLLVRSDGHCLVTPSKLFVCSRCSFQTRMCTPCLNSTCCPRCGRTSIPHPATANRRSLSQEEMYETTSADGSQTSFSAMTVATFEVNCIFAKMPKRRLRCSFCDHSTPMCVACLNDARCPNCHRKDIPLGDGHTDDEEDDGHQQTLRLGRMSQCTGIQQVELAVIEKVTPRPGWMAPFLLRSDERSQMTVRLMDLEENSGRCRFRRVPRVTLCPANFICQVFMTQDSNTWRIDEEGLVRFHSMRQIVAGLMEQSRVAEESCEEPKTTKSVAPTLPAALQNVTNLPAADPLKVKRKPIIEKV